MSRSTPEALNSLMSVENKAANSTFISGLALLATSFTESLASAVLVIAALSAGLEPVIPLMYWMRGPSSLGPISKVQVAASDTVNEVGVGVGVAVGVELAVGAAAAVVEAADSGPVA